MAHNESAAMQDCQEAGYAFWLTGLPGAGKTTLARTLSARLKAEGRAVIQLDGDRMRSIVGQRYSYASGDRHALAMIYAGFCREFTAQGHDVVCATVSMFHDVHAWSRANLPNYIEIYLRVPIPVLTQRHPKGLYAAALAGRIRNVPGVDQAIEEPRWPDLVIDDDGARTPEGVADELFRFLNLQEGAAP